MWNSKFQIFIFNKLNKFFFQFLTIADLRTAAKTLKDATLMTTRRNVPRKTLRKIPKRLEDLVKIHLLGRTSFHALQKRVRSLRTRNPDLAKLDATPVLRRNRKSHVNTKIARPKMNDLGEGNLARIPPVRTKVDLKPRGANVLQVRTRTRLLKKIRKRNARMTIAVTRRNWKRRGRRRLKQALVNLRYFFEFIKFVDLFCLKEENCNDNFCFWLFLLG